jgi:hypothetical protein
MPLQPGNAITRSFATCLRIDTVPMTNTKKLRKPCEGPSTATSTAMRESVMVPGLDEGGTEPLRLLRQSMRSMRGKMVEAT